MNKICGIYKITSPSNKIYIGKSVNIRNRISFYKNIICKDQRKLYNSILKYGWNAHVFEVIYVCQDFELNDMEKFYIKYYDTFNTEHGLNLTEGGNGGRLSEETRDRIRKSMLVELFQKTQK